MAEQEKQVFEVIFVGVDSEEEEFVDGPYTVAAVDRDAAVLSAYELSERVSKEVRQVLVRQFRAS